MKNDSNNIKKILNFQIIIMIISLILIILTFFIDGFADYREIILGFILLTMAYSNQIVYHKTGMTILYVVFGLLLIIPNIVRLVTG